MERHGEQYHGDCAKRLLLGDEVPRAGIELIYDEHLRGRRGHNRGFVVGDHQMPGSRR